MIADLNQIHGLILFMLGGSVGIFVMCLFQAFKRGDQMLEMDCNTGEMNGPG